MFPAVSWEWGQDRIILKLARRRTGTLISAGRAAMAVVLAAVSLPAQQKSAPQIPSAGVEFPVLMQQKVAAGKTPVGTKVQAKLVIATLVKGAVIPEGAILSGEVTESVAKSATMPSRLGVRMDSAQWKNGSIPIRVYLTAWYYPMATPDQELPPGESGGPTPPTFSSYPMPPRHTRAPRPSSNADAAPFPDSSNSQHRVLMKNIEPTRNDDGAVTLISTHSNLKLDKATTYVLAADGLVPAK
jgi:hypothetical protein